MSRVSGHELRSEGAAFRGTRRRPERVNLWGGVSGTGFALCSCGAASPVLESGGARKRWHRQHKIEVTA